MAFNLRNNLSSEPRIAPETPWVRPSDWPVIDDNDNMVQLLLNDTNRATYWFDFTYGGIDVSIDWGDGNIETLPNGGSGTTTRVQHTYTPGTGATCSLGYTTFVAKFQHATSVGKVIPATGGLTASDGTFLNTNYSYGILEMYIGDDSYNYDYTNLFQCPVIGSRFNQLTYVKFPRNIGVVTNFTSTFENCSSLRKVDLPESILGSINMTSTFAGCINITDIRLPSYPSPSGSLGVGITNLTSCFSGCRRLTNVIFPSHLDNLTTMTTAFLNNSALVYIDMPPMPNCLDFSSAFQGCINLQSFTFKTLPNRTSSYDLTFDSAFFGCVSLETVEFPSEFLNDNFVSGFVTSQMFRGCSTLRSITYPRNWNSITCTNTHQDCINLQYVNYQTPITRTGGANLNYLSHFQGCVSLKTFYFGGAKNHVMMNVGFGSIGLNQMFQACTSLSDVKISTNVATGGGLTSMTSVFSGCTGLIRADLTDITTGGSGVSGLSNLDSGFLNCSLLTTPLLQSSLNNITSFTSTFSGCASLKEFVIPNTLLVTLYSNMFLNCYSLERVSVGTTAAVVAGIGAMFQNCYSLKEFDFTNIFSTFNTVTQLNNLFSGCYSLERLNMGNYQMLITTFNGFLSQCVSLETVTNIDKVGNTSTSTGTYLQWINSVITAPQLQSVTITSRISTVSLNGSSATQRYNLKSLRLLNNSTGQFTGSTTPILVQWCMLDYAALLALFNDLAAKANVTGRTINITGNPGVASLTSADRLIITSKGWTIVS